MNGQMKALMAQRLASVSGHLCGVERLVQDGAPCIDLIRQIQAVQAALNKVSVLLLEAHLNTCILEVVQGEDTVERERVLGEIASIFEMSNKYHHSIKGDVPNHGN
jgi:CsoR family transcriptional regulator, copper-sensing transcriptional repressor